MNEKCMEKMLVEHCAPTLAGIKCANLFNYFYKSKLLAREELIEINNLFNCKGVYLEVLMWRDDSVLIYLYRKAIFQKCKDVYLQVFCDGRDLVRMTVGT